MSKTNEILIVLKTATFPRKKKCLLCLGEGVDKNENDEKDHS